MQFRALLCLEEYLGGLMRSKSVKEVLRILDWADILCLVEQGKDQVGESIKSQ